MFFEELVEQHRVYRIVAHGVDVALLVAHDQVGVYLSHFLGDQAKLRRAALVSFVVEGHRLKRQNGFAGAVYRFDFFLETTRRAGRAELAVRIVVGRVAVKRCVTGGRVIATDDVAGQRISADGIVIKSTGVAIERKNARGSVEAAVGITKQSGKTGRRILVATGEVVKRLETSAGVPDSSGAADEHANAFPVVGAGYVAVRVGTHRFRLRHKAKADQQKRDEKWRSCRSKLNLCIHDGVSLEKISPASQDQNDRRKSIVRERRDHRPRLQPVIAAQLLPAASVSCRE